jgi:hypothetical protein
MGGVERERPQVVQTGPHSFELSDPGRERFVAEHGTDIDARLALKSLISGKPGADEGAAAMGRLFSALAEMLLLPGDVKHISPDSKREYAALLRSVRQRLVFHLTKSATAQKRGRTYVENRILLWAENCGPAPTTQALEDAAREVVALSKSDIFSFWFVDRLHEHEDDIIGCIRAAAALEPRNGCLVSPGAPRRQAGVSENRKRMAKLATSHAVRTTAYEKALRVLFGGIGLAYVAPETRSSARSRARKRGT